MPGTDAYFQVERLSQEGGLSSLSKFIRGGTLDLARPVLIIYFGSEFAHDMTREEVINWFRGLIFAVRDKAPHVLLYLSCLLPCMVNFVDNICHIQRFNSALKHAVVQARNTWPQVKYVDLHEYFILAGFSVPRYFCHESIVLGSLDTSWKRSALRHDPRGVRLSLEGVVEFRQRLLDFLRRNLR